jgi:hypothetical protein
MITALVVGAAAMYVAPRLMKPASPFGDSGLQPAIYEGSVSNSPALPAEPAPQIQPRRTASRPVVTRAAATQTVERAPVRHHRSTRNSVLIVAGSAGTGAAIGALAGGGKGAGIGALAGGVGGLVYDRLTANK